MILLFSINRPIYCNNSNVHDNQILTQESIIRLTFDHSARIKSARHKLNSAEFNFKLFESEYTQFSPFLLNSKTSGDSEGDNYSKVTLGINKEFFDGSSFNASLGHQTDWGGAVETEHTQFFETNVNFPLFTSNRKLNRIIKRTFEENELFSANLKYVNTIRNTIRYALGQYFDLVPRRLIRKMLRDYNVELHRVLNDPRLKGREEDIRQLKDEIASMESNIQGWDITVNTLRIHLQRWIGLESLEGYRIKPIKLNFDDENYFGKYYVKAAPEIIFEKALKNDTEFKVLEVIKRNAAEKKRLAEKGKWDIFFSAAGRYNMPNSIDGFDDADYLSVNAGIQIKRFDESILRYTIQKAESDILNIESTIEDHRIDLTSQIQRLKNTLIMKKEQIISSEKSLKSRKKIYEIKKENFLNGTESVDNYIHSFRSLTNTERAQYNHQNNYFDIVRDLDFICGYYFEFLNIKLDQR